MLTAQQVVEQINALIVNDPHDIAISSGPNDLVPITVVEISADGDTIVLKT